MLTMATADAQNDVLDALVDDHRDEAIAFARRMKHLAEYVDLVSLQGRTSYDDLEVAGSCRLGRRGAAFQLHDAERYRDALPLTLELLARGELFIHQASVLLRETDACPLELARRVESAVLPVGTDLCPADLRRRVKRAVLQCESELDSEAAAERLASARAQRRVWTSQGPDGMAIASALLPAEQVRRWSLELDELVRLEKVADRAAGIYRTTDQIRADVFASLPAQVLALRGIDSPALRERTTVNVHVPMTTLLEIGAEPAELEGYGPISAEHVRLLLPHASLRRVLVDADTGLPMDVEAAVVPPSGDADVARDRIVAMLRPAVATHAVESQHDPSAALRRFVQVRDLRCGGVGCTVSARHCQQDHRLRYPDGPTAAGNLDALSESCHGAKHGGWRPVRGADGSTTWTSPLGRVYRRPPPYDPPQLPPPGTQLRPPRRTEPMPSQDDDERPL